MSAIITENFRRNNAALFLNDIISLLSPNKYYLGIGKQDQWSAAESDQGFTVPVPIGSKAEELEVLNNLSTLVKLNTLGGEVGRVIPSVSWVSGNFYKAYSSYDSSCFYPTGAIKPCYVTINGAIYMCLKAGSAPSTTEPSLPSSNKYAPFLLPQGNGDSIQRYNQGYVWVLVQEAPATAIIRTNAFTDVGITPLSNPSLTASKTQCGGFVSGFTVVKGGGVIAAGEEAYNNTSIFKLRRNDGFSSGVGAIGTAVITNGVVTSVTINNGGSGYTVPPTVTFSAAPSGGITAIGTAVITNGVVTSVTITNGGSGYGTSAPTIKFELSSDNLTLNATIVNGVINSISYNGDLTTWLKDAVFASVEKISGPGTGAVIIPTIAPVNGFAYIPANVMPSWFAGLAVKLNDDIENDNFYSRYRQISIIKNPTASNTDSTLNALKYFAFPNTTDLSNVALDANSSVITDNDGNVIGWADHVVNTSGNKRIYFHQNSASGYRELPPSGSIKIGGGNPLAYNSINTGEFINDGTAEVIFTENRSFITRASGQFEDLNLIIQF